MKLIRFRNVRFACFVFAALTSFFTLARTPGHAATKVDLGPWPEMSSPQVIGKRVAEHFIASPHFNAGRTNPPSSITYPETCTWYGALTFAKATADRDLTARLVKRFEPLFTTDSKLIPRPVNVDSTVFGSVPLEIYLQTTEQKYLTLGQSFADVQWSAPVGIPIQGLNAEQQGWVNRGLSMQTRFWIDDMYMITLVQCQAYRATHETQYLDHASLEMTAYLDALQQTNGLFYHAPDVPFFWGRGDGWVAAGMSELLRSLPEDHPRRARIMEGYKKMMAALLKYQDAEGRWHQLMDKPESWPESSCTGMFTFALISGVKNGWLDEQTYAPAARRGWLGLLTFLDAVGDVHEVCEGTGKKNDLQYYLTRARKVGDLHGQAPVLWCATALLR